MNAVKGVVVRRLYFLHDDFNKPLEPAYFVRFNDGRELKLGEDELVEVTH